MLIFDYHYRSHPSSCATRLVNYLEISLAWATLDQREDKTDPAIHSIDFFPPKMEYHFALSVCLSEQI